MNLRTLLAVATLTSCGLCASLATAGNMTTIGRGYDSTNSLPGERMIAGPERGLPLMKTGTVDTINAPVTLARQVTDETKKYGPLGVVSGLVRGGFKAAILAGRGLTRGTIGALDVVTSPMGPLD